MVKNLRNKFKNKKGFTLVELIVVIVIILVLAAVMVPSVLKYIEKANQANCKSDAATILAQLQADVADHYTTSTDAFELNGKQIGSAKYAADITVANTFTCTIENAEITTFGYSNGRYTITWSPKGGWVGPKAVEKTT